MYSCEISLFKEDKAKLFTESYNLLKDKLNSVGAEIKDYTIYYDDSNKESISSIINEVLDIRL